MKRLVQESLPNMSNKIRAVHWEEVMEANPGAFVALKMKPPLTYPLVFPMSMRGDSCEAAFMRLGRFLEIPGKMQQCQIFH